LLCIKSRNKQGAGLTFLELMIASALVSVLALAVYGTLSNGLRVWQRVMAPEPCEDVGLFFDKFARDLRNSFRFKGIDFTGNREALAFATLVRSPRLNSSSVGSVGYYYDSKDNTLAREGNDMADIFSGHGGFSRQLLKGVKSLRILYFGLNREENTLVWMEDWNSSKDLPLAVRLELELNDARQSKFVKTVRLPLSGT